MYSPISCDGGIGDASDPLTGDVGNHDGCEKCNGRVNEQGQPVMPVTDDHVVAVRNFLQQSGTDLEDIATTKPASATYRDHLLHVGWKGLQMQKAETERQTRNQVVQSSVQKTAMWYALKPRWIIRRKTNAAVRRKIKSVFSPVGFKVGHADLEE